MGVPTSEVGYTLTMPRREDHEVHKGHVVALEEMLSVVCFLLGNSPASEFYVPYKIQSLGNYPEESIRHSEHGQKFEIKNTFTFTLFQQNTHNMSNTFIYHSLPPTFYGVSYNKFV